MNDREPSTARRCAQLKQQIRMARCEHPEAFLRRLFLEYGGWVEYCTECDRITTMYENDPKKLPEKSEEKSNLPIDKG